MTIESTEEVFSSGCGVKVCCITIRCSLKSSKYKETYPNHGFTHKILKLAIYRLKNGGQTKNSVAKKKKNMALSAISLIILCTFIT